MRTILTILLLLNVAYEIGKIQPLNTFAQGMLCLCSFLVIIAVAFYRDTEKYWHG